MANLGKFKPYPDPMCLRKNVYACPLTPWQCMSEKSLRMSTKKTKPHTPHSYLFLFISHKNTILIFLSLIMEMNTPTDIQVNILWENERRSLQFNWIKFFVWSAERGRNLPVLISQILPWNCNFIFVDVKKRSTSKA